MVDKPRARFNWNRQAWFAGRRRLRACGYCGKAAFGNSLKNGALCDSCQFARVQEQQEAYRVFRLAVMDGLIRRLPDGETACIHCDAPATCWEHRDYRKPIDVQPACDSCNTRLGRGMTAVEAFFCAARTRAPQNVELTIGGQDLRSLSHSAASTSGMGLTEMKKASGGIRP